MADVAVDVRPPAVRRVYWDRAATIVTVVLAIFTIVTLVRLSDIYHYDVLTLVAAWLVPWALGFGWLILVVRAVQRRRIWAPVFVLPIMVALITTAERTEFPATLR